jgi:hypothetical protein
MSSAKGSGAGRTRPQAYQNRTPFRHNKGSKKTAAILATANSGGLCKRCADKIEWRLKVWRGVCEHGGRNGGRSTLWPKSDQVS